MSSSRPSPMVVLALMMVSLLCVLPAGMSLAPAGCSGFVPPAAAALPGGDEANQGTPRIGRVVYGSISDAEHAAGLAQAASDAGAPFAGLLAKALDGYAAELRRQTDLIYANNQQSDPMAWWQAGIAGVVLGGGGTVLGTRRNGHTNGNGGGVKSG